MKVTPSRRALIGLCALLAALAAGCAKRGGGETAPAPRRTLTAPIFVNVRNNHTADLVVYAVQNSVASRLGSVTAQSSAGFRLPATMVQSGASVSIRVSAIGATGLFESDPVSIRPATRIEVMVDVGISRMHIAVYDM